jgi:hypothetical protein
LSVLLGKGNRAFEVTPQTALTAFAAGATSVGMASADLNGDELTDFVVAESTGAQVLLGAGTNAIALADLNGDGRPDLIMTTSGNSVAVFLGNGDGTFQSALNSNANGSQYAVATGDFNGDGKPDLALIIDGGPWRDVGRWKRQLCCAGSIVCGRNRPRLHCRGRF